jgi:hypothetical protein
MTYWVSELLLIVSCSECITPVESFVPVDSTSTWPIEWARYYLSFLVQNYICWFVDSTTHTKYLPVLDITYMIYYSDPRSGESYNYISYWMPYRIYQFSKAWSVSCIKFGEFPYNKNGLFLIILNEETKEYRKSIVSVCIIWYKILFYSNIR